MNESKRIVYPRANACSLTEYEFVCVAASCFIGVHPWCQVYCERGIIKTRVMMFIWFVLNNFLMNVREEINELKCQFLTKL